MILYSNGCPKCNILQKKLEEKGLVFEKTDNLEVIILKGFRTAPVLYNGKEFLDFGKAIKWIQDM